MHVKYVLFVNHEPSMIYGTHPFLDWDKITY